MRKIFDYAVPVFLCFLVGFIASRLQGNSMETWYPMLNKPSLTPPDWVFPVAWSILYLLIGLAAGRILQSEQRLKGGLMVLWGVQLALNFLWSILFFYMQNPLLGLLDIVVLDVLVIALAIQAYKVDKIASWLFVPYALWLLFATYLNAYIFLNN